MVIMVRAICIFCIFIAVSQRSFVGTAPTPDEKEKLEMKGDENVKELENLKNSLGRTLSLMKTQTGLYSEVNGKKEMHSTNSKEVDQDHKLIGKLFQRMDADSEAPDKGGQTRARVRTDIDVPSKGIHKSVVDQLPVDYTWPTENNNRDSLDLSPLQDSQNSVEGGVNFSGGTQQFEPLDIAEYVFWTGDEKSVSRGIEDFLQRGMMTREDAILFLQQIKYNLDYLKSHYSQTGQRSRGLQTNEKDGNPLEDYQITRKPEAVQERMDSTQGRSQLNELRQLQEAYKKAKRINGDDGPYFIQPNIGKSSELKPKSSPEEDHQELIQRLRLADFLYTEYSLEEVIYQLAKMIFTQSLTGGSAEAQNALTKFINFLEKEAEQGHISRSLEKKVLDVLIASLLDTISEHPSLLNIHQSLGQDSEMAAEQHFLRQILELSPEDRALLKDTLTSNFDFSKSDNNNKNQLNNNFKMKEKKLGSHISYG